MIIKYKKVKMNQNLIIQYLLIYLLFIYQGAIIFKVYNDLVIIITFLFTLLISGKLIKDKKFSRSFFNFIMIFSMLLLLICFSTQGSLSIYTAINYVSRFLIVYCAYAWNKDKFVERFIKMSIFFATISIFMYFFSLTGIGKRVIEIVLRINPGNEMNSRGMILYTYNSTNGLRNQGIYGEPGLYQIILNTTLYFILFTNQVENRIKYSIIIITTIITTVSTTGYFSMIAILITYILYKNEYVNNKKLKKIIFISILVIITYSIATSKDSFIYEKFFDKFIDSSGAINFELSTGRARTESMMADLNIILKYPYGLGTDKYAQIYYRIFGEGVLSTCGLTRFIAMLGIIPSIIVFGYLIINIIKNSFNLIDVFIKLFMIVNTTIGQPQFLFPALLVLVIINNSSSYLSKKKKLIYIS